MLASFSGNIPACNVHMPAASVLVDEGFEQPASHARPACALSDVHAGLDHAAVHAALGHRRGRRPADDGVAAPGHEPMLRKVTGAPRVEGGHLLFEGGVARRDALGVDGADRRPVVRRHALDADLLGGGDILHVHAQVSQDTRSPGQTGRMSAFTRATTPTERHGELRIHVWSTEDIDELGDYWARNRGHLSSTQPLRDEHFWTVDGQRRRVEGAAHDVAVGRMYPFLVREDGRLIAEVGLSDVARGAFHSCHLGYSVDGGRLRSGIASWAVSAVVDIAFTDIGLHRVQAATMVDNIASQGVLRRCDFERIGVATGYLAIAGTWRDHVLWQRANRAMEPPAPG